MASLPSFDNTLGALFVGFSMSTVLYGMFLLQVHNYYRRYPSDKAGYKAIFLLRVLETAHQAFIAHALYYYSITNYMNMLALFGKPVWSLVFQLLAGAVVGSVVKFFFTLRVWRFSYGNVWLTAFLVSPSVLGIIALGIGVVNDIGIAIALCYYLQSMRSCYTHAMSFTTLIIYNFMPKNFIFVGCYFVLSKLYAVSFVAALNTRQIIRGRGTDGEPKKSQAFQIVTEQQHTRSLSIPLQTSTIKREDVLEVESRVKQEVCQPSTDFKPLEWPPQQQNAVENAPGFSDDLEEQQRPYYTVGW
ncbi:hypothetical protein OG21DRAFT_1524560 [Imleria badia]|nr:hypothetical protein OG21DRAFT_1524560 [Imleria badia]